MKKLDELLKTQTDQRLLRLFAVGCCRQIWDLLKDEKSRIAVEVAERFADGKATKKELKKANNVVHAIAQWAAYYASYNTAYYTANSTAYYAARAAAYDATNAATTEKQLELYHCLFTKTSFTTTSPNALNLAKIIYLERNWALMPILGDALEEVGVSEEVVNHCKMEEHARGCWVIDNLFGHRR